MGWNEVSLELCYRQAYFLWLWNVNFIMCAWSLSYPPLSFILYDVMPCARSWIVGVSEWSYECVDELSILANPTEISNMAYNHPPINPASFCWPDRSSATPCHYGSHEQTLTQYYGVTHINFYRKLAYYGSGSINSKGCGQCISLYYCTWFEASLAGQPTSAQEGKGLVNALTDVCSGVLLAVHQSVADYCHMINYLVIMARCYKIPSSCQLWI